MDTLSLEQLRRIMPHASEARAGEFLDPLNATMKEFDLLPDQRAACFLAQLAHESGSLLYVRELASGEAYEGRADLGNTQPGDGVRFKGRGLIQITGRTNYERCGQGLGVDLIAQPEQLETPLLAARSAGWFWGSHHLNELADAGDFRTLTRRINGGYNGLADRFDFYCRARAEFGLPAVAPDSVGL
ncbi:chitinase class I [mine drainage metagenome]|uniref:Chitinase class I n=1 Tax=mine drainage metagenome TaxID=410659 RepID=A0A1J5R0U5_9ZZZZ